MQTSVFLKKKKIINYCEEYVAFFFHLLWKENAHASQITIFRHKRRGSHCFCLQGGNQKQKKTTWKNVTKEGFQQKPTHKEICICNFEYELETTIKKHGNVMNLKPGSQTEPAGG